jgi:hypothetical protein
MITVLGFFFSFFLLFSFLFLVLTPSPHRICCAQSETMFWSLVWLWEILCLFSARWCNSSHSKKSVHCLESICGDSTIIRGLWPLCSPHLSPREWFYLCEMLKDEVCINSPYTGDHAKMHSGSCVFSFSSRILTYNEQHVCWVWCMSVSQGKPFLAIYLHVVNKSLILTARHWTETFQCLL